MSILVTGGSGLLGNAIKECIAPNSSSEWVFLSSKDGNLLELEETESIFKKYKPRYVIHLAAYVGGLYRNLNHNKLMFENNLVMNLNVVRCCHKYNVQRAIFCLSTCIFPDDTSYPINEDMLHSGPPHNSNYGYAYSKRMLQIQCQIYNETYNREYICVVPTNIYGKFDNFSLTDGHVIPSLIHQCYLAKKNNTQFIVKGSGRPIRQFIYSIDLAKAIIGILFDYEKTDSLIISPKGEISIYNLAMLIAEVFNYKDEIVFDRTFADGQYKKTVSNKKFISRFSNFKFTKIDVGMSETIKWFEENYDIARK